MTPLVEIRDLSVAYRQEEGWLDVVRNLTLSIRRGEVFGLVGESGCGKSTLAYQLLGYRPRTARASADHLKFEGLDLLMLGTKALQEVRGRRIAFVPQNPTTALNPAIRVGNLIVEMMMQHGAASDRNEAKAKSIELFRQVGLSTPELAFRRFPHQLSGGQQQRIAISMALSCNPDLLVLDEPTTGLDVSTQRQIVALLKGLRTARGLSMLYVTHDLLLLRTIADRIGVMYAGDLIETAETERLFRMPQHPYTIGLLASIPSLEDDRFGSHLRGFLRRSEIPVGCPFQPRCNRAVPKCINDRPLVETIRRNHTVACWRWNLADAKKDIPQRTPERALKAKVYPAKIAPNVLSLREVSIAYGRSSGIGTGLFGGTPVDVIHAVSFDIRKGETFALVGESGSGKSTIARAISGLLKVRQGEIDFSGQGALPFLDQRSGNLRRRIQYVFQNPDASLNPRRMVGDILGRPRSVFFGENERTCQKSARDALDAVRLPEAYMTRFPDQLSGGERQRVAIARALVAEPDIILCDEVLSALDVSVQASIIDLLEELKFTRGIALLFISHDLAVVRSIADRVGILHHGEMIELGETESVFDSPVHPYTASLLAFLPKRTTRRTHVE